MIPLPPLGLPRGMPRSVVPGMRLARVPRDVDSITTVGREGVPADGGLTRDDVERIWARAVDVYRSGAHPGLQVCLRRHGVVVLNRAIGHASGHGPGRDTSASAPMTTDTPVFTSSTSKGVTAFVVLMLHERGVIDIFDPVATYVPEFAAHGKQDVTVAHLLAHRAGIPQLPREVWPDRTDDWDEVVAALCDSRPKWAAGEHLGYHAISAGYLLGEIVRRATGSDIRSVLEGEILRPLGFRWTSYGVRSADLPKVARSYLTGPTTPAHWHVARALGGSLGDVVALSNSPAGLTGIVPSGNVVSTAEELSRFYEIFRRGGELDGHRVVSPGTVRLAITPTSGLELDRTLVLPLRYGYGPMLGASRLGIFGPGTSTAFGHLGFTVNLAWADPERAVSAAFLTNGRPLIGPGLVPWLRLVRTITAVAPTVPRAEQPIWDRADARGQAPVRPVRRPLFQPLVADGTLPAG